LKNKLAQPVDKEVLHKEIDLIQSVISRMANNSFLLKGWLISLIVIVLALTKDTIVAAEQSYFTLLLALPVVVFWYLDAFFLHKERCYRKLYEWVIANRNDTDAFLSSLNYKRFEKDVKNVFQTMFSKTLLPFYGITFLIVAGIIVLNWR
jgi:hypothetical protein